MATDQNSVPAATVQAFQKANQELLHAAKQIAETKDAAAISKATQDLETTHSQAAAALKGKN